MPFGNRKWKPARSIDRAGFVRLKLAVTTDSDSPLVIRPQQGTFDPMEAILDAILNDDHQRVSKLLDADRTLAMQVVAQARLYESTIVHWIYTGDTALHLAAAGHRVEIVKSLLQAGAEVNAAKNHRHGTPLHYAADGYMAGPVWDASRQVKTLKTLLDAGAKLHAQDKNGATALHRAVRTRSAAAVKYLLQVGGSPTLKNKSGSTPFHLAVQDSGHGGTGADAARAAQRQIIREFLALGVKVSVKDGKGKSVLDCSKSDWIRKLLVNTD